MIKWSINTAALDAKLHEFGSNSPQMRAALLAFARVLKTRIQLAFKTGTSPSGTAWKPLKFRSGQPLRDKGGLLGSIDARPDGDGVLVGSNLRIPGSSSSLGAVHQFGMTIKPKAGKFLVFAVPGRKGLIFARQVTIPARPFMPINPSGQVALPPAWEKAALASMARALELK